MELNYQDLKSAMEAAVATAQTERVEVQDALAAQATKIQELLDKLGGIGGGGSGVPVNGGLITQEQINELVALALSIPAAVDAIYNPADAPVEPPFPPVL